MEVTTQYQEWLSHYFGHPLRLRSPFWRSGWYKGAIGFGFANRRHSNNVTIDFYAPPGESYAESVFTYNFMVAMGYQLEFGWDAILSYQYLTLGDYREFDDLSAHLFEIGLGKNF